MALAYEMERLTPIDPNELYFDFVVRRDPRARQVEVTLRAVQKRMLDEVVLMAHRARARVAGILFGDDELEADRAAFPVDRSAWLRAEWSRRGNLALAALAAILFLAVIGAADVRGERSIDALNTRVEDAAIRAAAVERMEHRVGRASVQLTWLVRQRQAPLFAKTLADFSRVLPDGTWLRELSIDGATIHASGFSKDASALIGLFDRSALFRNAQFSAPVVRNPADGTDRFELTVELADRTAR
jgi:general secretion pathway protein L